MNRMLVVLSSMCVPMLSMAAPPNIAPVDVNVTNPVVRTMPGTSLRHFLFSYYGQPPNGSEAIPIGSVPAGQVFVLSHVTIQGYALTIGNPLHSGSCSLYFMWKENDTESARSVGMIPVQINGIYAAGSELMFIPFASNEGLNVFCNADVPAGWNMMLSGYFVPATTP
jgi:hypothetical protein